jgi:hypothetical protein
MTYTFGFVSNFKDYGKGLFVVNFESENNLYTSLAKKNTFIKMFLQGFFSCFYSQIKIYNEMCGNGLYELTV